MLRTGAVWLLLVAALFLRAVLPHGTMPDRDHSGAITVRICGSGGMWRIPVKADRGDGERDKSNRRTSDQQAGQVCAFAGIATPAVPPLDLPALPVPPQMAALFETPSAKPIFVGVPRPLPPARGPPLPA